MEAPTSPIMDPDPASRTPVDHAVEHVVIVMMENRSFDHALGYLGREGPLDPQDQGATRISSPATCSDT
jgi:phospholipase C